MTDSQPVPQQRSQNLELADFMNFAKFPLKTKLLQKFGLPDKRGFQLIEKRIKEKGCLPFC